MSDPAWVAVGRLWRARGLKGELIGEVYSSHPGRAEELKDVVLELEGRRLPVRVERVWFHDGRPVFKFVGMDSISTVEPWRGADILVAESERSVPREGEFSHADLIGCSVQPAGAENPLGIVRGIEEYGGSPLLRVEAVDGREILVPFARSICREIDVAGKIIRVELPEGLADL
ncbi:MAG: ribosome maturation factor RimM [Bryobacteraceae bacterium]